VALAPAAALCLALAAACAGPAPRPEAPPVPQRGGSEAAARDRFGRHYAEAAAGHPEVLERFRRTPPEERQRTLSALTRRGLRRLGDAEVLRYGLLQGRTLGAVDPEDCAAAREPGASPAGLAAGLEALTDAEDGELAGLYVHAASAELRGLPAARPHPTGAQLSSDLAALVGRLPPEEVAALEGLSGPRAPTACARLQRAFEVLAQAQGPEAARVVLWLFSGEPSSVAP